MQEGLYESVLTTELAQRLEALVDLVPELGRVDPADQSHVLSQFLAAAIQRRLLGRARP